MRHVSWTKLRRDENGAVVGFLGAAFSLRPGEAYLSAAWLEYFEKQKKSDNAKECILAFKAIRTVKSKERFAIGNVGEIESACLSAGNRPRIVHEPVDGFDAHAAVRQYQYDDDLLELLASEIWAEMAS